MGNAIKWPLLALTLTPLAYFPSALFPFITGKIFFIRGLIALFVIGIAVYLWRERKSEQNLIDLQYIFV